MQREQVQIEERDTSRAATAAVIQAIPLRIWEFLILLIVVFVVLAITFNMRVLPGFIDSVLRWLFWGVVAVLALVGIRLGVKAYHIYHDVVMKSQERKAGNAALYRQELQIRKLELQNEQLEVKIDLERQLPAVIKFALEQGHNIEYGKDGLRVQNYLSNVHNLTGAGLPELAATPALEIEEPSVRTFRQLLEDGTVDRAIANQQMLLGYADGQLRYGSWLDLYSCGIGGVSGSGKTTTVRFLLFQAILLGARMVMIDPHLHEPEESLAAQFTMFRSVHVQPPCDDKPADVAKRVAWLDREYLRRKAGGIKGPPIVFVLDEFNALVRHLPDEVRKELADLMLNISQEGRKFGLYGMLIAQRWSEHDLGGKNYGAAIRGSLASTLAHRFQDEEQAKKLAGSRQGPLCLSLPQGHHLFRDTEGTQTEMLTPATYKADGEIIQQKLDENTRENTPYRAENTGERRENTVISIADYQAENTDLAAKARAVMAFQAEGMQKPEIMRRVWGVNPGGTEEYKRAAQQYQEVMKYIAERLGA